MTVIRSAPGPPYMRRLGMVSLYPSIVSFPGPPNAMPALVTSSVASSLMWSSPPCPYTRASPLTASSSNHRRPCASTTVGLLPPYTRSPSPKPLGDAVQARSAVDQVHTGAEVGPRPRVPSDDLVHRDAVRAEPDGVRSGTNPVIPGSRVDGV